MYTGDIVFGRQTLDRICVCTYVNMCIYMYIYIYAYKNTQRNTKYIHTYIYIYIYINIHIYIYMCTGDIVFGRQTLDRIREVNGTYAEYAVVDANEVFHFGLKNQNA